MPTTTLTLTERLALQCRRIFLRDCEVQARIGAHAFEKEGPQRLIVNVELFVPLASSTPQRDQLEEVVDYDFVRSTIARRLANGHVTLQETFCDALASDLLAQPQVSAVRVSSSKPDVYPDCASVGVEVFRVKALP